MALLGGAGNPVGGSFTGPAQSLEYIGDHCAAFSGPVACDENETTLLEFRSTESSYIVGSFQFDYATIVAYSEDMLFTVYLNGSIVYRTILSGGTATTPTEEVETLIFPGTEVKVTSQNLTNTSNRDMAVTLIGRVYRQ